jgi:hypothetical protein
MRAPLSHVTFHVRVPAPKERGDVVLGQEKKGGGRKCGRDVERFRGLHLRSSCLDTDGKTTEKAASKCSIVTCSEKSDVTNAAQ